MILRMCKTCGNSFQQFNTAQTICNLCAYNKYTKPRKPIKRMGKQAKKWSETRARWFKKNKADGYTCYICGKFLTIDETTLDHVIPRSKRPDLRHEFYNLRPCCWTCNSKKGSKSLDNV